MGNRRGARAKSADGKPEKVDIHVGERIRARRNALKISQETMAADIGVTFQQVQKYESGHNRVSASRLWEISKVLKCRPGFFFATLDLPEADVEEEFADPMAQTSAIQLVTAFNKLTDTQQAAVTAIIDAFRDR